MQVEWKKTVCRFVSRASLFPVESTTTMQFLQILFRKFFHRNFVLRRIIGSGHAPVIVR